MKGLLTFTLGMAAVATSFGATIDISTGSAAWQVYLPSAGSVVAVTSVSPNGTWAPAPSGSSWVSYGANESISCGVGQTPGNGCAHTLINPSGDTWAYQLTISAATLGDVAGTLNFIFGSDNRVNLFIGNTPSALVWNGGSNTNGTGFNPLGCSGTPPTSAGNTQAEYNNCTGTVSFGAGQLNGDGSLTLIAYNYNDPIVGVGGVPCPACGDPTGFVLEGTALTGAAATPEPATFGLVALAGLAGLALRRKRSV